MIIYLKFAPILRRQKSRFSCSGSISSKKQNLPVFYLCIHYIEVRRYLAICYPTYFCVAITLQPFSCLHSYSFMYIYAYNVYMYRNPQSPAKFISHRLWTPVIFFWLGCFAPYFGKVLRYRYILTSRSLLLFCALEKNHFFMLPSICKLLLCSLGF
jgi:hypothetical protein